MMSHARRWLAAQLIGLGVIVASAAVWPSPWGLVAVVTYLGLSVGLADSVVLCYGRMLDEDEKRMAQWAEKAVSIAQRIGVAVHCRGCGRTAVLAGVGVAGTEGPSHALDVLDLTDGDLTIPPDWGKAEGTPLCPQCLARMS